MAIFFSSWSESISKTIFYGYKFEGAQEISPEIARRIERIKLAQEFPGWKLEYIDQLDPFTKAEIWGVLDADSKIKQDQARRQAEAARRARKHG